MDSSSIQIPGLVSQSVLIWDKLILKMVKIKAGHLKIITNY